MALRVIVAHKIMNEVIKQHKDSWRKIEWRVLVVDNLTMRMISACCKMHDIADEGVTLIEDLYKSRVTIPTMEAIYLITPNEKSVRALIEDFEDPINRLYQAAHVFFTEACPDELFNELCHAKVAKFIKTLKEINISFMPYERQVFSLDTRDTFQLCYNPSKATLRSADMERTAERIATLCATLREYPAVRYRADFDGNAELARLVQQKLDEYKAEDPSMGEGPEKGQSQLLILDRGFDCVSPVVHELTFQAMVYDLLKIENDVYKYTGTSGERVALLDENDEEWVELRHEHIAAVSQKIIQNLKAFTHAKRMPEGEQSARDLSTMIKKMPQYQKELNKYLTHLNLAESCHTVSRDLMELFKVEQDLATGLNIEGEIIEDPIRYIVPVLLNRNLSNKDKMRLIILFILSTNGLTSEDGFNRLAQHAHLDPEEKQAILNLSHLGVNIIKKKTEEETPLQVYKIARKDRPPHRYDLSRWVPVVKDLMEDCIDNSLDLERFPFVGERRVAPTGYTAPAVYSARYGYWHKDKGKPPLIRHVPRLIVFIVGGVTFSEMRCAYEVSRDLKNWEVIIGSSHIITPKDFLDDLAGLSTSTSNNDQTKLSKSASKKQAKLIKKASKE